MEMLRKLAATLRLLRSGPERLEAMQHRQSVEDARLSASEGRQNSFHATLHELVQSTATAQRRAGELDEYVRGVQAELHGFQTAAAAQFAELREQNTSLLDQLGAMREQGSALAEQVAELRRAGDGLREHVAAADKSMTDGRTEALRETEWVRNQVSALGAALDRARMPATGGSNAPAPSVVAAEEGFYPTLEHHFRGSTEDLRERLGAYRPWIQDLPPGQVADLGCGRGEWLELLADWNIDAVGVDLNAPNIDGMRARGLTVDHADALEWLQARPEASLAAVTSFHVIEHLPFGVLLRLVQEARRVLVPGGRLIMETPNPENVIVATQTFWLDPTHVRPLPPALLEVVVRDAGLELEALLRLNPPAGGEDIADPTLRALMTQGRDCAVVARKAQIAEMTV